MLYTKFQGNHSTCSGELRFFEGFLPYMGVVTILVMLPRCHEQTFVPPTKGGTTQNMTFIGQAVLEENMFEIVD